MNNPQELKYTKTDEWIKVEGPNATIGITDFAQDQLSDIVYVEFNVDIDENFDKDATLAIIESVKTASDIHAPASGKVIEINEDLANTPEVINDDPYSNWMLKIELSNPDEIGSLMDASTYSKFCEGRGH